MPCATNPPPKAPALQLNIPSTEPNLQVWVGVVTAFIFTYVPEWTSWVLLVAMALYDLAAVLLPGGPLKVRAWGSPPPPPSFLHIFCGPDLSSIPSPPPPALP